MSPRSSQVLRVVAGVTAGFFLASASPSAEARPNSPGAAENKRIVNAAPEEAAAIVSAFHLLSRKPEMLTIIDPDEASPAGQKILAQSDAFITKGGRIVYLNRHSEVLKGARQGSSLYVCMLAAIIWHEMAHIDGADEAVAQRREEGLWKRFVMDGRVDQVTALRYLKLMHDRHQDSAGTASAASK